MLPGANRVLLHAGTFRRVGLLLGCVLLSLAAGSAPGQTAAGRSSLTLREAIRESLTIPQARIGQDQVDTVRG